MVEKFASACGFPVSEFLHLNHTGLQMLDRGPPLARMAAAIGPRLPDRNREEINEKLCP
jgi:hypothetical protein